MLHYTMPDTKLIEIRQGASGPPSSTIATTALTHYANIRVTYYALLGVIAMALCLVLKRNKALLSKKSVVYGVMGSS